MQANEKVDFDWITRPRARVLGHLAAFRTEREIAELLTVSHSTVRGTVEAMKGHTGIRDVREIGRWWRVTGPIWLAWTAEQGGLQMKQDGS